MKVEWPDLASYLGIGSYPSKTHVLFVTLHILFTSL